MHEQSIPPSLHETIRKNHEPLARPAMTPEELKAALQEFAENLRAGDEPTIAARILLDTMAGRTEEWEQAVDVAYLAAVDEAEAVA